MKGMEGPCAPSRPQMQNRAGQGGDRTLIFDMPSRCVPVITNRP